MTRHSIAFILLWLIVSPSALACEHPKDYIPIEKRPSQALLYEISGCGISPSYLLGTFHSDSPKLQPIIEHALPYLYRTKTLWVEIKASPNDSSESMQHLTFAQNHSGLKRMIGESIFAQTMLRIAPILGMAEPTINRFRPWALALLVQYPAPESDGIVLDSKLQNYAVQHGVSVKGLETMNSQFQIFHDMPENMQINFLKSTLKDFDSIGSNIQNLQSLYLSQNLGELHKESMSLLEQTATEYPSLANHLKTHLIEERNHHMAQMLQTPQTPMFVAVGALHLAGPHGLLSLLEDTGLQIRPISRQSTP